MGNRPQQEELRRTGHMPVDQAKHAKEVAGNEPLPETDPDAPVPEDNQPGNRPRDEQDKPDLDAFRERFRGDD